MPSSRETVEISFWWRTPRSGPDMKYIMAPLTSQDLRTNVSALAQKLDSPNIDYVIMKSASTYLQGVDPNRKQAADIRDIINMIPLAVPGRQELDFNRSHDCKRFAMSRHWGKRDRSPPAAMMVSTYVHMHQA
ncbi:predicted protein [Histoplasma mississippiense (nom. inval.)]|uniref:predicted protein n=1 Tax=Ajellomyces capsulatus (strain NAm1 / WU24) TaxID=2059318 RepID=UPI000157BECB|nr:predicted protein [Histoplasma mississippiense (nom. inval.)]EDN06956.1 predicted protein [Histoplasma mississippiense (nom. inval.)]